MIDPLEEPNPEWDIFPHQPTKAMSETIQRYLAAEADMTESHEGQYVLLFDHQSALAAAQAEVKRLREESSRIIGERSDEILALREVISSQGEVLAALKRELEEARARQDQVLKALCWRLDVPRCEDFWNMVLKEAAALRPAMKEAREKASQNDSDARLLREILEDKGGLVLKVWKRKQAIESERDQIQSRVVELESRLKNE